MANARPLAQALFSPGILFNTIKSGIAVDYPVYTSSLNYGAVHSRSCDERYGPLYISSPDTPHSHHQRVFDLLTSSFDTRVPFEAIMDPIEYIQHKIYDQEVHPLSLVDGNGDFYFNQTVSPSPLYKMAINNFLAALRFGCWARRAAIYVFPNPTTSAKKTPLYDSSILLAETTACFWYSRSMRSGCR